MPSLPYRVHSLTYVLKFVVIAVKGFKLALAVLACDCEKVWVSCGQPRVLKPLACFYAPAVHQLIHTVCRHGTFAHEPATGLP